MSMRTPGEPRQVGWWRLWRFIAIVGPLAVMALVVAVPYAAVLLLLPVAVGLLVVSLVGMAGVGRGPAAFLASGRAFGVPSRLWVALLPLLWMVFGSVQVGRLLRPGRGGAWVERLAVEDVVMLVLYAVVVGVWLVFAMRRRSVALTPEGITRWGPLGRVEILWGSIAPAQQVVVSHFLAWWLHLAVLPPAARRRGFVPYADELPLQELDVDGRFVADAIEFYVRHPDRRAAIGSAEEHRRLFAELAAWYAAARPVTPVVG